MTSSAIRNLSAFFTPSLLVIPPFSSHSDILLNTVAPEFFATQQAIFSKSKAIIINQSGSSIPIEEVRKMIEQLSFGSFGGELQAVFLPHLEQASIPAQNALLKILEEPPTNTKFFITATAQEQILETILSRCEVSTWKDENKLGSDTNKMNEFDIENNDLDIENTRKLIETIRNSSARENIELAETYQSKQEAINIATNILKASHQHLQDSAKGSTQNTKMLNQLSIAKTCIESIKLLQQNVNVKLVMVECFLKIKTLS